MGFRELSALFGAIILGACFSREPHGYCEGSSQCGKGEACLVGRCSPLAEPAVAPESRRVVLSPTDIAVLSSRSSEALDAEMVPLGRSSLGGVVVLLHFDTAVAQGVEIKRAILALEPPDRAPAPVSPIALTVASIEDSWQSQAVSWGRSPRLSVADEVPKAAFQGHGRLQVDVTHLFASSRGFPNGLALAADGTDPVGAVFSTGLGSGIAPRLELYLVDDSTPLSASASASSSASAAPSSSAAPSASASADDDEQAPPKPKKPKSPKKPSSRPSAFK